MIHGDLDDDFCLLFWEKNEIFIFSGMIHDAIQKIQQLFYTGLQINGIKKPKGLT